MIVGPATPTLTVSVAVFSRLPCSVRKGAEDLKQVKYSSTLTLDCVVLALTIGRFHMDNEKLPGFVCPSSLYLFLSLPLLSLSFSPLFLEVQIVLLV